MLTNKMSAKKKNTNRERVVQDIGHGDLFLIGGNAFNLPPRPPDVQDYRGPLYYHDSHMEGRPLYQKREIDKNFHMMNNIDKIGNESQMTNYSTGIPGHEPEKRGLFNPNSRPPSGLQSRGIESRAASSLNKPSPDLSRPESFAKGLISRPSSALSRPGSAYRPVSRAGTLLEYEMDPDHEPITDVLSRLDDYSQNFVANLPVAYTDCECTTEQFRSSSRQVRVNHGDSDHSESDDEEIAAAEAQAERPRRRRTSRTRKRTLSGRSISDHSDMETEPFDIDHLSKNDKSSSSSHNHNSVLNGATMEISHDVNNSDNASQEFRTELHKFIKEKLCSRYVLSISELKRLLNMKLSQAPPGYILNKGVTDKLCEQTVIEIGGIVLNTKWQEEAMFMFVDTGDELEPVRKAIYESAKTSNRLMKKTVMKNAEAISGKAFPENTVKNVLRDYCVNKNAQWFLKCNAGVTMDVLLKTFQQFEEKGHSSSRQKAMMTLVNSYTSLDTLSDQQLHKLIQYMETSVSEVQDACLILLKHCVKNSQTLGKLLENSILNFLYDTLKELDKKHLRRSALLLLEQVFSDSQFKNKWYELSVTRFIPKLISMVRGEVPLDVKYAACCVFRSFALYEDFIVYVTDQILLSVLLMRNASAKFKEVYFEILTGVLSHTDCFPPDLVDSSAIPMTVSIIREGPCGPQRAALHLLSSLTTSDTGLSTVIGTKSLVPMLLCCMKESHCRKVRQHATEVIRNLCTSRKLGLCKDLMLQLSNYLVPSLEQESLTSLSQMASSSMTIMQAKPRFDEERQMWLGLEKFIDMTKGVIHREAKVEVDDLGLVTRVLMKPCIDTCPIQLDILAQSFHVLQYMCLWPLDKSRLGFSANRVDLTTFTDDEKQKLRLSKVNRGLTQAIWDKVGVIVTDLLLSYAKKFTRLCEESSKKGRQSDSLDTLFESGEVTLITSLLELTLCSALCTCVEFPDIMPKLEVKSPKKKSKHPNKLQSFSTSQICNDNRPGQSVESRLKSQSDTGKGFAGDGYYKVWERENPHLSTSQSNKSHEVAMEKSKAELRHKEACTDRRLLRKCLYEADVFRCVCPFIKCSDQSIQILVLQILRCMIQPLEERVAPKLNSGSGVFSGKTGKQRPQTAGAIPSTNKRLSVALHQMSPDMANLIKEALGPNLEKSETKKQTDTQLAQQVKVPGAPTGLETIHERLQEFTEQNKLEDVIKKEAQDSVKEYVKPVIDRCRPIAQQCREALIDGIGEKIITGIFTKAHRLKKHSVLLLHDYVQFGESSCHMVLSRYGCMPRLIDFLRVNEDNELLEIIGLIIVRIMVSSDNRLRQLFNRHGGPQLLLSMAQYTKGLLKQEVTSTLNTVSKVESVRKRPMSAPVHRTVHKEKAPDVWDHIQARWRQEDQVASVLRQWMIADRKQRIY